MCQKDGAVMKDWKTWAILLLATIALYQHVALHEQESLLRMQIQVDRQKIDQVSVDALKTRLDSSTHFMVQMNCALFDSSLKQWHACVIKGLQANKKSENDDGSH
jgi:hypothetical protein